MNNNKKTIQIYTHTQNLEFNKVETAKKIPYLATSTSFSLNTSENVGQAWLYS